MRNAEQEAARGKSAISISQRRGSPETPYRMATNIRGVVSQLTATDRTQNRRKKDHRKFQVHKALELGGFTIQAKPLPTQSTEPFAFTTPLTDLQNSSILPNSPFSERFNFPHLLTYKAYFGPPTVQREPNKNEGSMVRVGASFRLDDLEISQQQAAFLKDVVGERRVVSEISSPVVCIDADLFEERNQNAAYLGDIVDVLLQGVKKG